jgi:hypothetical protein
MVFQTRILLGVGWIKVHFWDLPVLLSFLVSWSSRKWSSVAQSTTEAEYVAAASCCFEILWITYTMSDFSEEYTQSHFNVTAPVP